MIVTTHLEVMHNTHLEALTSGERDSLHVNLGPPSLLSKGTTACNEPGGWDIPSAFQSTQSRPFPLGVWALALKLNFMQTCDD